MSVAGNKENSSGGGSASLLSLFEPPVEAGQRDDEAGAAQSSENNGVQHGQQQPDPSSSTSMPQGPSTERTASSALQDLFTPPPPVIASVAPAQTDTLLQKEDSQVDHHESSSFFVPTHGTEASPLLQESTRTIQMGNVAFQATTRLPTIREVPAKWSECLAQFVQPTTWIGGFMFLLYHIVFSLTMGAAITRPHPEESPIFGVMTKMSASGVMFASVVYWWSLSDDVPALYPAVDLFCAPFLANLAAIVDDALYNDANVSPQDNDAMFLASFTFLVCLALTITATLLMLASVFKLANLGAFLPSPVLSGFFSAVGVLLWTLAVKVDTGGQSVGQVLFSGDWNVVRHALVHHVPSVVVAMAMKYLSPKSPFYVVVCIVGTIAMFYVYMGVAHVGLEDMVEAGWFWSKNDLVNKRVDPSQVGFSSWAPPAPAGWINSWAHGNVHWGAVQAGLSTAVALAFLYMIRCSLHGAALRKNIGIMERFVTVDAAALDAADITNTGESSLSLQNASYSVRFRKRRFSEAVDVGTLHLATADDDTATDAGSTNDPSEKKRIRIQSQPTQHSLTEILAQYAYSQYICAFVGGFAMTPSIGPSSTLYSLGAESVAPQLLSVLFLSYFYLTNFFLVMYIPKPAFSSVLVLAAIDILDGWFIKSFKKTRSKVEWLVNPFIVATAFCVGLLSSVFLGIAMSTFFFVASFYRSGVVKYVANGITMRSTIQRPVNMEQWLDENGDLLQILVLQSYLFFGNASSVLNYVSSMFDDTEGDEWEASYLPPPMPKIVILDFSLVPGMDGSAVDVMADLLAVCSNHDCKLFFSGISPSIRKTMQLGGVKSDSSKKDRSQLKLRFFPDLDSAVGKAEDLLIQTVYLPSHGNEPSGRQLAKKTGFLRCLAHIDKQHETSFEEDLAELGSYTRLVELQPGEVLYEEQPLPRGLFFIEEGTMRIERSADNTRSLTHLGSSNTFNLGGSLNQLKARRGTVARHIAHLKAGKAGVQTFRLARIGPGWVIGDHEALSGLVSSGETVAVDYCRLHYISYETLEELETGNPMLILTLYKLLSRLNALRSEVTIGQLATMHNIMSAPAHNRPMLAAMRAPKV